jgi:phage replication O-like protein O
MSKELKEFTRIKNDVLGALILTNVSITELKVSLAIIRKTWGWRKKSDLISLSQLAEATSQSRRSVIYALNKLEKKNMIKVQRSRQSETKNNINRISFNKDFKSWVVKERSLPQGSANGGNKVVNVVAPTKETLQKKEGETSSSNFISYVKKHIKDNRLVFTGKKYSSAEQLVDHWMEKRGNVKDKKSSLINWINRSIGYGQIEKVLTKKERWEERERKLEAEMDALLGKVS